MEATIEDTTVIFFVFVLSADHIIDTMATQKVTPQPEDLLDPRVRDGIKILLNAIESLDKSDDVNPMLLKDTLDHFSSIESLTSTRQLYMEEQPYMTSSLRTSLIGLITRLHYKLCLVSETLGLSVNLLDRFLAKKQVLDGEFVLIALTCLSIASKLVDSTFHKNDKIEITDYLSIFNYTKKDMGRMEKIVLSELDCRIYVPTSYTFLGIYLNLHPPGGIDISRDSFFILDCTLGRYHLLEYLPSEIACASILIARLANGETPWCENLTFYTKYNKEDILPVARSILSTISLSRELGYTMLVYGKYNYSNLLKLSALEQLYKDL